MRFFLWGTDVHLLYVDESGSTTDPSQSFFVLSGISVHEKKTHWVEEAMNSIAKRFNSEDPYALEMHGSPMRSGKSEWRGFDYATRVTAMKDCLSIIAESKGQIRIFASITKQGVGDGSDTVSDSFAQIASRFDMYLARLHAQGNTQRGIAIFDKSSTEKSIQQLARDFKNTGHQFGRIRNFSEVPLFLDSKASRLIQLADLVAYAIFRKYEANDSTYYDVISGCFDNYRGTTHGLHIKE